jgi:phage shock protein A
MNILERISKLLHANINHLLDRAEDPEVMVKQIIRDMEGGIIDLRRETVRAVAREKRLQQQMVASRELVAELEDRARAALSAEDENLARRLVSRKLHTLRTQEVMQDELRDANRSAQELKDNLIRLEDQVQAARRKKDDLIRRKRVADAVQRAASRSSTGRSATTGAVAAVTGSGRTLESYEADIAASEALAEAEQELLDNDIEKELELQKLAEQNAVDEELRRLKGELESS